MLFDCQASERLHEKMTNFVSKNKVAQIQQGSRSVKVSYSFDYSIGEDVVYYLLIFQVLSNFQS